MVAFKPKTKEEALKRIKEIFTSTDVCDLKEIKEIFLDEKNVKFLELLWNDGDLCFKIIRYIFQHFSPIEIMTLRNFIGLFIKQNPKDYSLFLECFVDNPVFDKYMKMDLGDFIKAEEYLYICSCMKMICNGFPYKPDGNFCNPYDIMQLEIKILVKRHRFLDSVD